MSEFITTKLVAFFGFVVSTHGQDDDVAPRFFPEEDDADAYAKALAVEYGCAIVIPVTASPFARHVSFVRGEKKPKKPRKSKKEVEATEADPKAKGLH